MVPGSIPGRRIYKPQHCRLALQQATKLLHARPLGKQRQGLHTKTQQDRICGPSNLTDKIRIQQRT